VASEQIRRDRGFVAGADTNSGSGEGSRGETVCAGENENTKRSEDIDREYDTRAEEAVQQTSDQDSSQQARAAEDGGAERGTGSGQAAIGQQGREVVMAPFMLIDLTRRIAVTIQNGDERSARLQEVPE